MGKLRLLGYVATLRNVVADVAHHDKQPGWDLESVGSVFIGNISDEIAGVEHEIAHDTDLTAVVGDIEHEIAQETNVTMEHVQTIEGDKMPVGRGILQRITDPGDLREPWAAPLYIAGDIYVFFCLHLVVHSRFSPAMEKIVELSGMNDDVAGATLLAIGTSLPEVLSGAVGVFVPGAGDTGLGTVVGSLVFNMLVITGSCVALFPKSRLVLSRSATIRDVLSQVIVIGMLVWAFSNKQADVSNVVVFLLAYVLYTMVCAQSGRVAHLCAADSKIAEESNDSSDEHDSEEHDSEEQTEDRTDDSAQPLQQHAEGAHAHESLDRHWPPPADPVGLITWILAIPLVIIEVLIVVTIPDIHSPKWKKCLKCALVLNLLSSAIWLGALVLFMIEWATKAGEMMGISPAVMGLTFCAAGTSVPDCMVSIIVAKQGKGNMAISNVFGSNVFDILIAMAVPWALKYAISGTENKIQMEADGFGSAVVILALVMAFYISVVCFYKFELPRRVGYLHLALYVVFVIYVFVKNMSVFHEDMPTE